MKNIDVKDKVLEKIKAGQIKMKSKATFTLQKLGLKSSLGLIIALAILIFSLVIFFFKEQSSSQMLGLGDSATTTFITDIPFSWIIFIIALMIFATYLFRKYTFAYRKTWKFSFTNLAVIVILIGTLLSMTSFHNGVAAKAAESDRPFLKSVYRRALTCDFDQEHLLIGIVQNVDRDGKSAEIVTRGHQKMHLKLFNDTRIKHAPRTGDAFAAVGYKEGNIFYAEGVRRTEIRALKNRCLSENQ